MEAIKRGGESLPPSKVETSVQQVFKHCGSSDQKEFRCTNTSSNVCFFLWAILLWLCIINCCVVEFAFVFVCRTVFAQLVLPIFQLALYNLVMGREPYGLNIAYVSHDWNNQNNKTGINTSLVDFCSDTYNSKSINGSKLACLGNEMTAICTFLNQFEKHEITWVRSIIHTIRNVAIGN